MKQANKIIMPASSLNTNITPKITWGILNTLIGRNNTLGGISESFKINGNITNDKKKI